MPSLPAWPKTAITGKTTMLTQLPRPTFTAPPENSPLVLSDHLITLAKQADRAGYTSTASRLITLACSVFDEAPNVQH
jgi:hypothetical protein